MSITRTNNPSIPHAQGAIFGALAGDAAGATLEFMGRRPNAEEINLAMDMTGAGVWRLAPGQITDDGELTLALAYALNPGEPYDPNMAASQYRLWRLTSPFDVGNATNAAMKDGTPGDHNIAQIFMENAARFNMDSKANGGLMRATPLGVWGATMSLEELVDAARADSLLSHPHPSCQWAVIAYSAAIRHLVLNTGDRGGAFETATEILCDTTSEEVAHWLQDASSGHLPAFHPQAGYVRIGFTHAFHHLWEGSHYTEAIRHTLAGGGDTDTNACIVGGLIGALHGIEDIPLKMKSSLLNCDTGLGRPRPQWLSTRQLISVLDGLTHRV